MVLEYFSWCGETVKRLFLPEILSIITYERNRLDAVGLSAISVFTYQWTRPYIPDRRTFS